jgi:multiple sugar transport system ATP-binding protein
MARVVIDHLVKTYAEKSGPGVAAVKGISLAIEDREFMVLVGPSGCGKSTTLRMIAGLEEISGGTISIDGKVVNDVLPKDRDIAMVFQNYALYPHMSVYENMAFGLKLRKFTPAEIETRVREAASMLQIEPLLDRKPRALSGGQRQRVAVGRAIVRKPKVFLFDEPLSNLDAKMRASTRTEISKLHQRLGATMIYVTHDQIEAMTMGDRICVMKDGDIMQVAPPLELYNRPANLFVAGFIGSPPMNFFRGTVRRTGEELAFIETNDSGAALRIPLDARLIRIAQPAIEQPVVFGIRAEDVRLAAAGEPGSHLVAIEVAEPMGAETFLHLSTGVSTFIARVSPDWLHTAGSGTHVRFDLAKAHLFDATTEHVLTAKSKE